MIANCSRFGQIAEKLTESRQKTVSVLVLASVDFQIQSTLRFLPGNDYPPPIPGDQARKKDPGRTPAPRPSSWHPCHGQHGASWAVRRPCMGRV